jgi:thioredoxin-like negative regulator of GroEL
MKRIVITLAGLATIASINTLHAASVQSINSTSDMENVLKNNKQVVAEFYDSECGACQAYRRTGDFERAAGQNPNIKFVEINMRTAQPVFQKYGAQRVPSILFFSNGKQIDSQMGAPSSAELNAKIQTLKSK